MCRGEAPPGRLLRSAWELQQCAVVALCVPLAGGRPMCPACEAR